MPLEIVITEGATVQNPDLARLHNLPSDTHFLTSIPGDGTVGYVSAAKIVAGRGPYEPEGTIFDERFKDDASSGDGGNKNFHDYLKPKEEEEAVSEKKGGGNPKTKANAAGRVATGQDATGTAKARFKGSLETKKTQLEAEIEANKDSWNPYNWFRDSMRRDSIANIDSQLADMASGRDRGLFAQINDAVVAAGDGIVEGVEGLGGLIRDVGVGTASVYYDVLTGDIDSANKTIDSAWNKTTAAAQGGWNAVVNEPWFQGTRDAWNSGFYGTSIGSVAPDALGAAGILKGLAGKLGGLVSRGALTGAEAEALATGKASAELVDKAKKLGIADEELATAKKAAEPEVGKGGGERVTKGDPVVVTRGEYIEEWDDFYIDATVPVYAKRYYGNQFRFRGALGLNRTSLFDGAIFVEPDNTLEYLREDGARIGFERPFDEFPSRNAAFPSLELTAPRLKRLELRDKKLIHAFRQYRDKSYRLEHIRDLNGNRIDLIRDARGLLVEARHSDGFSLSFENDATGRRISVTWHTGGASRRLVDYAYDRHGNMVKAACANAFSLAYTYDARNRLESWRDITGRSGSVFFYDDEDRVVRTETTGPWHNDVFEYDRDNRVTTYRPGGGDARERFWYDEDENVTREENQLGGVKQYEYDEAGFRTAEVDEAGARREWSYDADGNIREYTDAEGRWTHYTWGPYGDLDIAIDGTGNAHEYEYDALGNLILSKDPLGHETRFEWTRAGRLSSVHYPDGSVERREYDAHHRLVALIDPLGGRIVFKRDAFGRVVSRIDAGGQETRFVYDEARGKDFYAPTGVIRPDGVRIERTFDAEGQIASVTDGEGRCWRYTYGPFDLLTGLEEPGGGRLAFDYDILKHLTQVTDALGRAWRFERDAAGRVISETDFTGLRHDYAYDAAGRVIEHRAADGSKVCYDYDRAGLVVREALYEAGAAEPQDETRYSYDRRALLVCAENKAAVIELTRDALGRVTEESVNGRVVASVYDGLGRRVSCAIGGQLATSGYDPLGLLSELIIGDHAPLTFRRDALGQELLRESSAGFRLEQGYDALGQLVKQQAGFSIASLGAGTEGAIAAQALGIKPREAVGQVERAFSWNKAFEPLAISDKRWGRTEYLYDANGQIKRTTFGDGGGERFTYDLARNTTGFGDGAGPQLSKHPVHRGVAGSGYVPSVDEGVFEPWRSVHDGQVSEATGPHGECIRLAYDSCNRVIERIVERKGFRAKRWRYEWDAKDRLVACVTPEDERWIYGYDPFGRRVYKINVTAAREAARAAGMRPVNELMPGAFSQENRPNRYASKKDDLPIRIGTAYSWDGHVIAEEAPLCSDGATRWHEATRWYYEPGSFVPLAKETADGKLVYIVADHLGTPREMFSENGQLVWAGEYRTWGAVRRLWRAEADNDNAPNFGAGGRSIMFGALALQSEPQWETATQNCPIRFQGQWEDSETGLYYNRFRHYDPLIGQYMSPDPIGLTGGTRPLGYVHNPNGWIDPLGLAPKEGRYWTRTKEFRGNKVYQRDDLIDPNRVDSRTGLTNKQLMESGRAPYGPDGKRINLHHGLQSQNGPIFEMTETFHQQNYKTIHLNPNTIPSGINRSAFDAWRAGYWKFRAPDF